MDPFKMEFLMENPIEIKIWPDFFFNGWWLGVPPWPNGHLMSPPYGWSLWKSLFKKWVYRSPSIVKPKKYLEGWYPQFSTKYCPKRLIHVDTWGPAIFNICCCGSSARPIGISEVIGWSQQLRQVDLLCSCPLLSKLGRAGVRCSIWEYPLLIWHWELENHHV
jgi:hypothetical protein